MASAADNAPTPPLLRCVLWHPPGVPLPSDLLNSLSKRIGRISVCSDAFAALAEVCIAAGTRAGSSPSSQTVPEPSPHSTPSTVLLLVHPPQLSDVADVLAEIRTFAPSTLCWKYDAAANPKLSAIVESDVSAWTVRGTGGTPAAAGVESLSTARTTNHGDQRALSSISSPFTPATTPRRAPSSPDSPDADQRPHPATLAPAAASPRLRLTADGQVPPGARPIAIPDRRPEVVVRPQPHAGGLRLRGEPSDPTQPPAAPPPARPVLSAEEMRMLLGDDPMDGGGGNPNGHHPAAGPGGEAT